MEMSQQQAALTLSGKSAKQSEKSGWFARQSLGWLAFR
jgi:hypothetical protein